ncbi:MAG: DUF4340 domain-containing protein [Alphaproteobacteria bacterium]|nr:DUF4340 domain-containing protein [Alphaproteobacteria bacterium]
MEDRQTRTMLILAAVLVALVLLIRFAEPPSEGDDEEREDLLALEDVEITSLSLVTAEGTLHAERSEAGWLLTAPVQARGDDNKLDALVQSVDRLTAGPVLEGADPAKYGLDEPVAALTLRSAEGVEYKLDIGAKAPVGYKTYVRVGDGGVRVASGDPGAAAGLPFGTYRDATVWSVYAPTVTALRWKSELNEWSVERQTEGWRLGDGRRADARAVSGLLDRAGSLRFESFQESLSPEEAGLLIPSGVLMLVDDSGERQLTLGAERNGGVIARSPAGVVGTVDGVADLDLALGELLEARLLGVTPAELVRVELDLDGASAEWTLVEGAWQRDGAPAPDGGVRLIDTLAKAGADRAVMLEGLEAETGSLVAHTARGALRIQLGQALEGGVAAHDGQGPGFLVPTETLEALRALLASG